MTQRERIIMAEIAEWPDSMQAAFKASVRKGNSIPMAHMLASRQGPGMATDDEFLKSDYTLAHRCDDPQQRHSLVSKARAAGLSVDEGCRYEPGLGKGPTDPNCWFTRGTGRGELQKRIGNSGAAASHNLPMGIRQARPHDKPPEKVPALSDNLIREVETHMIAKDPALALTDRRELRERIVATHGSKNRKG